MTLSLVLAAGRKLREAVAAGRAYKYYAPTTLTHLAALVPAELDARIRLYDQGTERLPDRWSSELVAISCMTCSAPEAYRIAARASEDGATVLMGGPHVSALPSEALRFADAVAVGYADESWPRMLEDWRQGRLQKVYRARNVGFGPFRGPDRSYLKLGRYLIADTLEVTRGCPNSCSYCVMNTLAGGALKHRPVRSVVEEIEGLGRNVLFLDANPLEHREYMLRLLTALIPLRVRWFCGTTLKLTEDRELFDLACRSGLKGALIGFESINQGSLNGVGKRFHQTHHYKDALGRLRDRGVAVFGCFIFGFDQDDRSVFDHTVRFVDRARLDIVKYGILTPLPGSLLFDQMGREGRILTRNWELYDSEHCVFRPAGMNPEQLEEGYHWAYRQTYSLPSIIRRTFKINPLIHYSLLGNLGFRRFTVRATRRCLEDVEVCAG